MYIQITTRCNMRCEHCGYACTAKGEDMSLEVFNAALTLCDGSISLGGGEPTIHPMFWEFFGRSLATDADCGVWLATNGKETQTAIALANIARRGVCGVALSRDPFHEDIDDRVVKAFTRDRPVYLDYVSNPHSATNDAREIRDTSNHLIKAGRCRSGSPGCICEDLFIRPNGDVHMCGCKRSPRLGNVLTGVEIPDTYEYGECYKNQAKAAAA